MIAETHIVSCAIIICDFQENRNNKTGILSQTMSFIFNPNQVFFVPKPN